MMFREPTFEAWSRDINRRLAQLERLPHATNAVVAASDLSTASVSFEAAAIQSSGTYADPTLLSVGGVQSSEEGNPDDPYMVENYDPTPTESLTDLNYAPVAPSVPIIESTNGSVSVTWDGTGAGGEAMPVNLSRVEVHRSVEGPDFETSAATYGASMTVAGTHVFSDQMYDVVWWYKLVAITQDGLRSTDSASASGAAVKVAVTDVSFSAEDIDTTGAIAAAQASADGKNTIWHKTYAPTSEANVDGDTWFQHDPVTGVVVAQFTGLGGAAWAGTTLSHQVISSIDLGTATVGKLSANYIDSGVLQAGITVTGYLLAGDPEGARVTLSEDGLRQYGDATSILVNFSTDPAVPSTFEGAIIADSITSNNRFAMRGIDNELSKGAKFTLSNGTTSPTSAPSAAVTYEKYDGSVSRSFAVLRGFHHDSDGANRYMATEFFGYGYMASPSGEYNFPQITMNGSTTSTRSIAGHAVLRTSGGGVRQAIYAGRGVNGGTSRTWFLELYDGSVMVPGGTVAPTLKASLATDDLSYLVDAKLGRCFSAPSTTTLDARFACAIFNTFVEPDTISLKQFTCTESSITQVGSTLTVNSPFSSGEGLAGVTYGSSAKMLFPGTDQMIWLVHGTINTYAYSDTGSRLTDFDFPTAPGDEVYGDCGSLATGAMTFIGFRSAKGGPDGDGINRITKYTNNHWTSATSSKWWIGGTWYDPDPTVETAPAGGVHETALGPMTTVTMKKRASVSVTVPTFPARPFPTTTDDVLASRLYIGRSAVIPTRTNMEYVDTVTSPTRSLTIGTFTFPAGAAVSPPPAASNFPSSAPGSVVPAATTNWQLLGDGSAIMGPLTVPASGVSTIAGSVDVTLGDTASANQRVLRINAKATSGANYYSAATYLGDGTTVRTLATVLSENGTEVSRFTLLPSQSGLEVRTPDGSTSRLQSNGVVSTFMRGTEFKYTDTSGLALASATPVAVGARGGSGTFVAPPSGAVKIGFGALVQARTTGVYVGVHFELRTGSTVGSGTVVRTWSFNDAALHYAVTLTNVWSETTVTGLTGGDTYNIQNLAASADTTAGANLYRGRIIVTPLM